LKNIFKNIQTLLIVVLILVILFLRNCSSNPTPTPNPDPPVVVRVETKWDTIIKIVPIYIPKWKTRTEYKDTTIYKDVDTAYILKDYFATYTYFDTLYNDSITIRIKDSISRNQIKSRSIEYDLLYPTITITRDSVVKKRGYYLGVGLGGTRTNLTYVGGEILYTNKKKTAFGIGFGVNPDFNLMIVGKLYWKLGK